VTVLSKARYALAAIRIANGLLALAVAAWVYSRREAKP